MKNWKKIAYAALSGLVLLIGFLMPKVILQIQDARFHVQVDTYALNNEPLRLSSHLVERLTAINEDMVVFSATETAQMQKEAVYRKMLEAASLFNQTQLYTVNELEEENLYWEADPMQLISADGTLSFIVWYCYLESRSESAFMVIDDETGKVLCIKGEVVSEYGISYDVSLFIENIEDFRGALEKYYDCDSVVLERETQLPMDSTDALTKVVVVESKDSTNGASVGDDNISVGSASDIGVFYTLTEGELQTTLPFEFGADGSYYSFNYN